MENHHQTFPIGVLHNLHPVQISSYCESTSLTRNDIHKNAPGYEVYSKMGLYQRDLATFDEYAIIENTQVPGIYTSFYDS